MIEKKNRIVTGMVIISSVLTLLIVIPSVSATNEFWACVNKGERINYCNNYKPSETCSDNGGCQYCMSVYRESENCYIHGSWPKCLQLDPECSGIGGGGGNVDGEFPSLTLYSPLNNSLHTSRSVQFKFSVNELSDVYYLDLINGRGRWTRVCTDCTSYDRTRRFSEGLNNLMIRVKDLAGNENYTEVSFFVDSRTPRIKKTEPKKGFSDGTFKSEIDEENPKNLTLYYGVVGNMKSKRLDLNSDCYMEKTRQFCETNVNLAMFNNQDIEYYFVLIDIVGNVDESKHVVVTVDNSPPVLNNPGNFWAQGEDTENEFIFFNMDITEPNFDEVYYSYVDTRGRLREMKICSRLKEGICERRVSFRNGHWDLTVSILDDAGNSVGFPVSFDVI